MKTATKTALVFAGAVTVLAIALNGQPGASLAEETASPSDTVSPADTVSPSDTPTETPSVTESPTVTPSETPSVTPSVTPTPTPTPTLPPPDPRLVTSVTVAVIENHGRQAVAQKMPKITAYGKRYATGSNAYAITHPSKPNYLVLASGSTQKETSNRWAYEKAPALFDLAAARGGIVRTYAQSMGADNCNYHDRGAYRWHHNWQPPFTSGNVRLPNGKTVSKWLVCEYFNRDGWDSRQLWTNALKANRLGVVNMVLPDNNHNWHDSPYSNTAAKRSDDWIAARVAEFVKSPAYAAGGVFIITADEARPSSQANDVPLYVVHKSLNHKVTGTKLSLKDIHAFMAEVAHVKSGGGTPGLFAKAFGLKVA